MGPEVTELLVRWSEGDARAGDDLFPLVYGELLKIARARLRGERRDHTLQTTALVNEAYLRLVDQERVEWRNRAHFFGISAQIMRRILVDHARRKDASKRGGDWQRVTLSGVATGDRGRPRLDVLMLDAALVRLVELDPDLARTVELRYFGGLTIEETAEVMGVSPTTVKREWATAKMWLARELEGDAGSEAASG